MKINIGDIYREQKYKYVFGAKFASEKILDLTYGKFFDFAKTELLLSNNVKEIWSLDLLNNEKYFTIRKFDESKKIYFEKKPLTEINPKFNSIFSFNVVTLNKNFESLLELFQKYLSDKGTVIISILNYEVFSDQNISEKTQKISTKNTLEKILKQHFTNITFYYQGEISQLKKYQNDLSSTVTSQKNIKSSVKNYLKNFFTKNENRQKFYVKYVQPRYFSLKNSQRKRKLEINPSKYEILPYDDTKLPISILAVCKK